MAGIDDDMVQQFRSRLENRARELRTEVGGVEADRAAAFEQARDTVEDAGDEAEDRREDEVRSAEEDRDQGELREIAAAIARIDAGSYGECVDCGTAIPLPRLQVQPAATRCIACQQRSEALTRTPH